MGRLCARRGVCGGRTHRRRRVKKNRSAGPSGPADFLFSGPSQTSLRDASSPERGSFFWREPIAAEKLPHRGSWQSRKALTERVKRTQGRGGSDRIIKGCAAAQRHTKKDVLC